MVLGWGDSKDRPLRYHPGLIRYRPSDFWGKERGAGHRARSQSSQTGSASGVTLRVTQRYRGDGETSAPELAADKADKLPSGLTQVRNSTPAESSSKGDAQDPCLKY